MPLFRIHRIKPSAGEAFRWAAHTGGLAIVKERDYERGEDLDAPSTYAAWKALAPSKRPFAAGDLLEDESGKLHILKYIGFEPAQWFVPEPKDARDITPIGVPEASGFVRQMEG
ncbi:MAG: hypothetical protein WBW33_29940 [Bryobacteraceae bacterium]